MTVDGDVQNVCIVEDAWSAYVRDVLLKGEGGTAGNWVAGRPYCGTRYRKYMQQFDNNVSSASPCHKQMM